MLYPGALQFLVWVQFMLAVSTDVPDGRKRFSKRGNLAKTRHGPSLFFRTFSFNILNILHLGTITSSQGQQI